MAKSKRKKKNAVTLILLLLALAALIGVYVWYCNKPVNKEKSTADKGTENISLAKVDETKVTQLHYIGGSDADITFVLDNGVWKSKENPNRPINQENVTGMLSLVSKITASRKIVENPDNLADYGLDKPYAYIQATLKDKSTITLKLGDEAVTGDGYYAMVNDSKTVYLVTVNYGSGLNYSDIDFTQMETTPTITATNITYINIDPKDGQNVELKYNDNAKIDNTGSIVNQWEYLKPYGKGYTADTTAITTLQSNYTSFDLVKCVDYSGKNFAKYGLDKPAATIDIGYFETSGTASPTPDASSTAASSSTTKTNKEFKFYVGNKDKDDDYYIRLDGSNMVYTMAGTSVEKMLKIDTFSLLNPYINLPNINTVDRITADIGGTEYNMTMTHKTKKDSDGQETTVSTYQFNGKKAEQTAFQDLYKSIICQKYDAELTDKVDSVSKDSSITLTFYISGDNDSITTAFRPYNDSFYIADKGTGRYFLVDKRTVDDMVNAIKTFNPSSTK
jgi:hypothetical protein